MNSGYLQTIIRQGEGVSVEFKESRKKLNKDVFETVCAFLNRHGGHMFLGVDDDGEILGVSEESISNIVNSIVTQANNPEKISPPVYVAPEIVEISGRKIVYTYIPELRI